MPDAVKTPIPPDRSARVPYRTLQALETKRRIAAAARRRFAAAGYAGTSIESIAAEVGVAVSTVYAAFGTKAAILAAIHEAWLTEANMRPLMAQALAAQDPTVRLGLVVRAFRQFWEHGSDVRSILEAAADDPGAAGVVRAGGDEGRRALGQVVLGMTDALAPGLTAADAAAILAALTKLDVYEALVSRAGWSADRYEAWLTDLLRRELLAARRAGPSAAAAQSIADAHQARSRAALASGTSSEASFAKGLG